MAFDAKITATLSANSAQFNTSLDNASTKVSKLEAQMRRAGALPMPGEKSARDSAGVFERHAQSVDKVTEARYRAMDAAKAEESVIRGQIRLRDDATPATPKGGIMERFSAWRKKAMQGLSDVGGSDLVKGLGVGALVQGFRAVLSNAQQVRDEAYAIGAALDPAVERTAQIADTFDRAKEGAMSVAASVLSFVQGMVDRGVSAGASLFGMGSYSENMAAIKEGNAAEAAAKREAATAKERARLEAEAAREKERAAKAEEEAVMDEARAEIERQDAEAAALAEALQAEREITAEKQKQAQAQRDQAAARAADLARAASAQTSARAALATALSDQSAAGLSEITGGTRGSRADQRRAAEVERLRAQARTARDQGRVSLIGGEAVSVADQLSTRANQVQRGIQSLNTAERDPLSSVTAQLVQANAELAEIRESLAVMELDD